MMGLGNGTWNNTGSGFESNNVLLGYGGNYLSLNTNYSNGGIGEMYINIPGVNLNGRKGGGFGEGSYNSAILGGGMRGAMSDWNFQQNWSAYYEMEQNSPNAQSVKAFERFLFLEMPLNFAGGELFTLGWRAAGIGRLFARTAGNLSESVANTFQFGRYSEVVLDKPMVLSRYYDNVSAFAKGRYMTDAISSPVLDRIGLAIKPSWNSMTKVASWEIPAGSTVYRGRAAMQFPWIGGKTQYFVPNLSNVTRVIP